LKHRADQSFGAVATLSRIDLLLNLRRLDVNAGKLAQGLPVLSQSDF
jgi:hypothetical protein